MGTACCLSHELRPSHCPTLLNRQRKTHADMSTHYQTGKLLHFPLGKVQGLPWLWYIHTRASTVALFVTEYESCEIHKLKVSNENKFQ